MAKVVENIDEYAMPVVVLITDATYLMVKKLSGEDIPIEMVDEGMSLVWKGEGKYEILNSVQLKEKYKFAIDVGRVIFVASEG